MNDNTVTVKLDTNGVGIEICGVHSNVAVL